MVRVIRRETLKGKRRGEDRKEGKERIDEILTALATGTNPRFNEQQPKREQAIVKLLID